MDKEQQQQPPASVSSLKSFFEQDVAKKAPQQTHLRGAKSRPPSSTVATTVPVNKPVSVTRGQKKPPPDKPVKPKHLKQQSPLSASSSSTSFAYVNPETFNKAPFTAYQEHNSPGRNSLQRGPQESLENPFDGSPGTSPSKSVVTARLGNSNPFDDGDTNVAPPPLAIRPNVPPQQIVNSTSNNLLKPPGPSEEKRKMERKPSQEELHRQAILKELKESEEAFLSDMRLLVEVR